MRLYEVIWKEDFVDKIERKHRVTSDEVEQVLFSKPHARRAEKGRVQGEDLYVAYGQTAAGRHLVVFFILKYQTAALPISARDMTQAERRYYAQQRKAR
ncbi:MAG: BrnT family toxin [Bacteroidota bacterium]